MSFGIRYLMIYYEYMKYFVEENVWKTLSWRNTYKNCDEEKFSCNVG